MKLKHLIIENNIESQISNAFSHFKKNRQLYSNTRKNAKKNISTAMDMVKRSKDALGLEFKSLNSIKSQILNLKGKQSSPKWKASVAKNSDKIKKVYNKLLSKQKSGKQELNEGLVDWAKSFMGKAKGLYDKAMVTVASHPIASKLLLTATLIVLVKSGVGGDVMDLVQQLTSDTDTAMDNLQAIVDAGPEGIDYDATVDSFQDTFFDENGQVNQETQEFMSELEQFGKYAESFQDQLDANANAMESIDSKYGGSLGDYIESKGYSDPSQFPDELRGDAQKYVDLAGKQFEIMDKLFTEMEDPLNKIAKLMGNNIKLK